MAIRKSTRKGIFITIEGIEASGKSTAIAYVVDWAKRYGLEIVTVKEPGGTEPGLALRQLFLSEMMQEKMSPITELCLLFGAKAQLLNDIIIPAYKSGKVIVCDRYTDSLIAYQGAGKGIPIPLIKRLERATLCDVESDHTLFMDINVNESLQRIGMRRGVDNNIMDFKPFRFYQRVRRYFKITAKGDPRYTAIDGSLSRDDIREIIIQKLDTVLTNKLPYLTDEVFDYKTQVDNAGSTYYTPIKSNR